MAHHQTNIAEVLKVYYLQLFLTITPLIQTHKASNNTTGKILYHGIWS